MPDKIKSKDLQYDSSLPPFLQRLHDQKAGRGDQDRHERPIARPKMAKDPHNDDGPTIVDENGETLTSTEVESLQRLQTPTDSENVTGEVDPSAEPMASGAIPDGEATEPSRQFNQAVTDGTAQKKRKVAKVVGDDEGAGSVKDKDSSAATTVKKKAKKKRKPVKLAFDDEDGS